MGKEFTKEDKAKFTKLGVNSSLELALYIPYTYEDLHLYDRLYDGKAQLIDATVESVFRAPNSIQITFYVHNFAHQPNQPSAATIIPIKINGSEKIECSNITSSLKSFAFCTSFCNYLPLRVLMGLILSKSDLN
jgi:RecG-like helicase